MKSLIHYFSQTQAVSASEESSVENVSQELIECNSDFKLKRTRRNKKKLNTTNDSVINPSNFASLDSNIGPVNAATKRNIIPKKLDDLLTEECKSDQNDINKVTLSSSSSGQKNLNSQIQQDKNATKRSSKHSVAAENHINVENDISKMNAFQFLMESRNKNLFTEEKKVKYESGVLIKSIDNKRGLKRKKTESEFEEVVEVESTNKMIKRKQAIAFNCSSEDSEDGEGRLEKETKVANRTRGKKSKAENATNRIDLEPENTIIKVKMFSPKKNVMRDNEQEKKGKKNKRKSSKLSLNQNREIVEQIKASRPLNVEAFSNSEEYDDVIEKPVHLEDLDKQLPSKDSVIVLDTDGSSCDDNTVDSAEKNSTNRRNEKSAWRMKIKIAANDVDNKSEPLLRRSTRTIIAKGRSQQDIVEENPQIPPSEKRGCNKIKEKKNTKLAPIFLKNSPKETNSALIEAKRSFLRSGIPESLRKIIDEQKSVTTREFEVFPKISHIQQKNEETPLWNLSCVNLRFKKNEPPLDTVADCRMLNHSKLDRNVHPILGLALEKSSTQNLNVKHILKEMKDKYPEFPLYRTFRLLREKSCKYKPERKPSRKKQARKDSAEPVDLMEYAVWTEKYKTQTSADILGNHLAIRELKNWLKTWVDFSKQVCAQRAKKKRSNSSSSDFDTSDSDSWDGHPNNAVIVSGAVATGKTMAVYAIANELDINVLELNASSKRTGKRLLQELQEATQSHQVQKNSSQNVLDRYRLQKKKQVDDQIELNRRKMCLILVEDVDIVFEQDEGFIYSLNQLLNTSKRPIVLITSDLDAMHLTKFRSQYKVIRFNTVSDRILTSWLQLVCLLEGLYITREGIQELLLHNKCDVRRTLLYLQFWVTSTEEKRKKKLTIDAIKDLTLSDDDNSRLSLVEDVKTNNTQNLAVSNANYYLYDDVFWANNEILEIHPSEGTEMKRAVQHAASFLETTSFVDTMNTALKINSSVAKLSSDGWKSVAKDSLELGEILLSYINGYDTAHEIERNVLTNNICAHTNSISCNYKLPNTDQLRWCKILRNCDRSLAEVVPSFIRTDRNAVAVDYLPYVRDISRLENERQELNNKRSNRFYSYLQRLGLECSETVLKTAPKIFTSNTLE